MRLGYAAAREGFSRSAGVGLEEGPEGFSQRRAAAVLVGDQVEGACDLEVLDAQAPGGPAAALLLHSALGDERDTDAGLDGLLDGLGRTHFPPDAEIAESLAGRVECCLQRGARPRPALADEKLLAPKLFERDLLAPVPGMRGRYHHHDLVRHQLAVLEAAVGQPRADHAQLRPALEDPIDDRLAVPDEERDRDLGVFLLEAADERRQDVLARDGAGADEELAAHLPLEAVHRLAGLALQRQHSPGVAQQELAGLGDGGAAAEAIEQAHAQLVLKGADMLRDRRLGEVQRVRGLGEGAELGDFDEDLELPEVHGGEYRGRPRRCPARRARWVIAPGAENSKGPEGPRSHRAPRDDAANGIRSRRPRSTRRRMPERRSRGFRRSSRPRATAGA